MSTIQRIARVAGLALASAVVLGISTHADATPVPPKPSSALLGTWINVNPASNSVKQIVVRPNSAGSVSVDAFGACTPTLCEWGSVPAIVYGATVSSTRGATFESRQRFLTAGKEWSRTTLIGSVAATSSGLRLTLREFTTFSDSTSRKNYARNEVFKLGKGLAPTKVGNAVTGYATGHKPLLAAGALGTWKSTSGIVKIKITNTTANPLVHAYGKCTPTPCDWGIVKGITYGTSISSPTGAKMIAPYVFGFKKTQLVIAYSKIGSTELLTVTAYNEFTDHSGRSNYATKATFVRA